MLINLKMTSSASLPSVGEDSLKSQVNVMINVDVEDVLKRIKRDIKNLQNDLENPNNISGSGVSPLDIAMIVDNFRRSLDFIAHDIVKSCKVPKSQLPKNLYFPYRKNISELESNARWLNYVKKANVNFYTAIVNTQDFSNPEEKKWLTTICNLNNTGKHINLIRPKRHEVGRISTFAGIQVDATSTVTVGALTNTNSNRTVRDIKISPETPTEEILKKFDGSDFKVEFTFDSVSLKTNNNEDIINIFQNAIEGLEKLVSSIYQ